MIDTVRPYLSIVCSRRLWKHGRGPAPLAMDVIIELDRAELPCFQNGVVAGITVKNSPVVQKAFSP